MMRPQKVTKDQLLAVLTDIVNGIANDDSMEGNLTYEWADEPGFYLLHGAYRTGNSMGQGGMRIIGETVDPSGTGWDSTSQGRVIEFIVEPVGGWRFTMDEGCEMGDCSHPPDRIVVIDGARKPVCSDHHRLLRVEVGK